jgi:hypothetical protein
VGFLFCLRVTVELDSSVFENEAAGELGLAFEFGDGFWGVETGKGEELTVDVDLR